MTVETALLVMMLAITAPLWAPFVLVTLAVVLCVIAAAVEYLANMLAGIAGLKSDKTKEKR